MTNILLIHGAWQGAWAWGALTPLLEARGWRCHAVDLPGNGEPGAAPGPATLDGYVAHCARVMPERAVVMGHSGGGVVAAQLAEEFPERVSTLVFLAGMMLPSGVGFAEVVADTEAPGKEGIVPYLQWSADRAISSVPVEAALEIFLHDCPAVAARAAAARLRPQATTGFALKPKLSHARFGRVKRIYIEAVLDRSVVLGVQRRMQALVPGAEVLSMRTGHVPQLAAPETLAELLEPLKDGTLS